MKQKTLKIISMTYAAVLLLLAISNAVMSLKFGDDSGLGMVVVLGAVGVTMMIGSILVGKNNETAKLMLAISGFISFPLGLIVVIPALKLKK